MESLPNIIIALGAIGAATLTGIISFISLINLKEGKISEFRQNWIDCLRGDIAEMLSSFDRISSCWQFVQMKKDAPENTTNEYPYREEFLRLTIEDQKIFSDCHNRISLRLNNKEHPEIVKQLRDLKFRLSDINFLYEKRDVDRKLQYFQFLTQKLLKIEWERVKDGEKSYRLTKYVTLVLISCLFLFLGCSLFILTFKSQLFMLP